MAHFAELDDYNKVLRVVVVHNNELLNDNGDEDEIKGIIFCQNHFGENTRWIQTSYNANFRKRFAGINFIYDEERDAFIPPRPNFPSWNLNEDTYDWEPPVPMPMDDTKIYLWNEETLSWDSEDIPLLV